MIANKSLIMLGKTSHCCHCVASRGILFLVAFLVLLQALLYRPANSYGENAIKITHGLDYELCQDYRKALIENQIEDSNYCGVSMPQDNADFSEIQWEDLNPIKHMNVVKSVYFWGNLYRNTLHIEDYKQQLKEPDIRPELLASLWKPAEKGVLKLIREGRVILQVSSFDADYDGNRETVYRMTPIQAKRITSADGNKRLVFDGVKISSACTPYGLPVADRDYMTFIPPNQLEGDFGKLRRFRLWQGLNFFYWRGRAYWQLKHEIWEPVSPRTGVKSQKAKTVRICSFKH